MSVVRVTVAKLIHESRTVLGMAEAGERVEITRHGRVIAVLTAPDASETAVQELVDAGQVAPDWRERQAELRTMLRSVPAVTSPPGPPAGSDAILADRDETDR